MSLFKKALAEYPICGINMASLTSTKLPMTQSELQPLPFDAFNTELEAGVNLIEASAGTGKTFSIAMLVLRFVVEHQLPIEKVLVVTFTKAATQELRTRIRMRLQDLKRFITDPDNPANQEQDPAFIAWASQLEEPTQVAERVATALASIDNAAIFTIHSFCQRMLRQYALESGQLFDAELSSSVDHLKLSLAEDYWRQQLYAADALTVSICTTHYKTPSALLSSISPIQEGMQTHPSGLDLDKILQGIRSDIEALRGFDQMILQPLTDDIASNEAFYKSTFVSKFSEARDQVLKWLANPDNAAPVSSLKLFSFDTMMKDALNGTKFRKTKLQSGEERKTDHLAKVGITQTHDLDGLLEKLEQVGLAFRLGLLEYLAEHLQSSQSSQKVLSFNDLIVRLSQVLKAEGGDLLQAALRRQFAVALIDEFQDTDQQQWDIFSTVYSTPQHYLYLIGDPKQAIYKFRGADIYSYLNAKHSAHRAYTLETNFRSHPKLVTSVNQLFAGVDQPFLIKDIPYYEVKAGKSGDKLWWHGEPAQSMVLWLLEDCPDKPEGYWTSGAARKAIRVQVVNEIVRLLDAKEGAGKGESASDATPVEPQDIAILVRGNEEAAIYQNYLQEAGVPAVLNSKHSVFESEEANYLLHLLHALLQPANLARVRQALTLPWFGLDGQAFDEVCRDDMALQQFVSDFQLYQQRWQQDGLMAMMRALMAQHEVLQNLSKLDQPDRRITNLNHILELLQQVATDERLDMYKTVQWLNLALQGAQDSDGQELRLEQDEAAVSIVTIHSAKGLEYPIVFCPELWAEKRDEKAPSGDKIVVCHEDERLIADLGTPKQQERFEQAKFEQRAEDLRLLYVAVTRAASRCYMPWATVRTKTKDNNSAFAYLLMPHSRSENWSDKLQALSKSKDCFEYVTISAEDELLTAKNQTKQAETLVARTQQSEIRQRWQMSSYSALAYLSHHTKNNELPTDKSQEPVDLNDVTSVDPLDAEEEVAYQLPKGAHTGNVLHDLLENNNFAKLAVLNPESEDYEYYAKQRERSCMRYGLSLDEIGEQALDELLKRSVAAPLDTDDEAFTLANIQESACLKEMPFYFAINDLQTQGLNHLLADQPACQALSPRELSGQLTGFIDLIGEYDGRYYVMDYKSNALEQYDHPTMEKAMQEHNYGLQYFLYSVVLHHYLEQRLPGYDYEQHFGGVRYLFLRGMDREQVMQGVFVDRPSLEIIEGISDVLSGVGV